MATLKRRHKRTFRRSKSLERIAALEINLEKASLPKTVAELDRQIEKVIRSETRDYTLIPAREHSYALYRGRQDQTWQVLVSVLAVKLKPLFAEALALAQSRPEWTTLTHMLAPEKTGEEDSAAREMLRALAAECFQGLLERLRGDGDSLLTSILPPTLLHFLLEMDSRHQDEWRPRADRLLFFQLRFHRLKAVGIRIRQLSMQDSLDEAEQKALATLRDAQAKMAPNWKACRDVLQGDRECGQAHLLALARLTQVSLSPEEFKRLGDQSRDFSDKFHEVRLQCLSTFLGPRSVGGLFKRHVDPSHRTQARFADALGTLLKAQDLMARLLNCPPEQRHAIREAAARDLPQLQAEWEGIRGDLVLRSRTKALLEKSGSQKRGRKQFIEPVPAQMAAIPSIPSIPATPRPSRHEAPLEPPSLRLSRDNAKRRFAHLMHFIEELQGLTVAMGPQVQASMESVAADLRVWGERQDLSLLSRDAMLEKCLELLSHRMLGHEKVPGEAMPDLDVMFDLLSQLEDEKASPGNAGRHGRGTDSRDSPIEWSVENRTPRR